MELFGFFGKNHNWEKTTRNGQKWPKNRVFGLFRKITSLVLPGICENEKFAWKSKCLGIIWFSSRCQKWLSVFH